MSNPTTSRRDGEATRQRLLRAALDLYTTIGFRATTTPAIAARAGVAEGNHLSPFQREGAPPQRGVPQRAALGRGPGRGDRSRTDITRSRSGSPASRADCSTPPDRDPSLTRMLLRSRDEQHLDERSREAAREFRQALQQVVAGGGSEGAVRSGPTELWTDVWLALVAFAAERVGRAGVGSPRARRSGSPSTRPGTLSRLASAGKHGELAGPRLGSRSTRRHVHAPAPRDAPPACRR